MGPRLREDDIHLLVDYARINRSDKLLMRNRLHEIKGKASEDLISGLFARLWKAKSGC